MLTTQNGEVRLRLASAAYSLTAIKKTAYRFAKDFAIAVEAPIDGVIPLRLVMKSDATDTKVRLVVLSFLEELLDQQLREEIGEETKPIRALVLAHAFSRANVVRRE